MFGWYWDCKCLVFKCGDGNTLESCVFEKWLSAYTASQFPRYHSFTLRDLASVGDLLENSVKSFVKLGIKSIFFLYMFCIMTQASGWYFKELEVYVMLATPCFSHMLCLRKSSLSLTLNLFFLIHGVHTKYPGQVATKSFMLSRILRWSIFVKFTVTWQWEFCLSF